MLGFGRHLLWQTSKEHRFVDLFDAKTAAVYLAPVVTLDSLDMRLGAVAFVSLKAILGVACRKFAHDAIARHFGDDTGGTLLSSPPLDLKRSSDQSDQSDRDRRDRDDRGPDLHS